MKVVSALRKRCEKCHIVRRGKKVYIKCTLNPRHKQRQGSEFSTFVQNDMNFHNQIENVCGLQMLLMDTFYLNLIR